MQSSEPYNLHCMAWYTPSLGWNANTPHADKSLGFLPHSHTAGGCMAHTLSTTPHADIPSHSIHASEPMLRPAQGSQMPAWLPAGCWYSTVGHENLYRAIACARTFQLAAVHSAMSCRSLGTYTCRPTRRLCRPRLFLTTRLTISELTTASR